MSRRILVTILGITVLAVTGFGVPLAASVRRIQQDDERAKLEREAAAAAAVVPVLMPGSQQAFDLPSPRTQDVTVAVYDLSGTRVAGSGPDTTDRATAAALQGHLASDLGSDALAIGWPLTDNGRPYGAVRAAVGEDVIEHRVRVAWAAMAALGAMVIAAAGLVAWRQARRLGRPVGALTAAVDRLGDGDFTVRVSPTGVAELDRAGRAVEATAGRLGRLVARERRFSADASHQLRTPLTGLRLTLELGATGGAPARQALRDAIGSVDKLETTIDDLLGLARDEHPSEPIALGPIVEEMATTWAARLAGDDRSLQVAVDDHVPMVDVAPAAVRQILEVLVGNAHEHGRGTVTVAASPTHGGVVIEVSDEGPGVRGDPERVFARGEGTGTGIGLALARSLAEAEGGRLTLRSAGPVPRFRLLLPASRASRVRPTAGS